MPLNSANILVGPARVFLGSTAPTTGSPPNAIQHTNGVPVDGTEIGYTEGNVEFQYELKKVEIAPEQSLAPVDVFSSAEAVQVTFTAMEDTYNTLLRAFDNVGTVSGSVSIQGGGSKNASFFYFGAGTSILAPFQQSVFFSAPERRNSGKYVIAMLYQAYCKTPIKLPFTKTKPTSYQMTFVGTANTARTAGDQLGQFCIES